MDDQDEHEAIHRIVEDAQNDEHSQMTVEEGFDDALVDAEGIPFSSYDEAEETDEDEQDLREAVAKIRAAAEARIAELETENADIKDKAARALAEADNIRKRAERAQEDTVKFAITKFAKDMLDVADNMRRAIEAVPEDQRESNELVKNILIGVEVTERTMLAMFSKHGIEKIEPSEGKFDPNQHEVMFEAEIEGKAPGEIIQLISAGYQLNGRLLRPARVGVAKGVASRAENLDEQA